MTKQYPTFDETGYSVGFVILAHRLPQQLVRLIDALTSPITSFHVHIDRDASIDVHDAARSALGHRDDVVFLPHLRTPWGSPTAVQAALSGIRSARDRGSNTVVVLSGQDYPIKPTDVLLSFLQANQNTSFIELTRLPRPDWPEAGGLERYTGRGVSIFGRQWVWRDRRRTAWMPRTRISIAPRVPFHGASQYVLAAKACDLLLNEFESKSVQRAFNAVSLADETAIHTILANSVISDDLINRAVVYADWSANGSHPEVLGMAHLASLRRSEALFARKFDVDLSGELLDAVDLELRRTGSSA